MEIGEIIDFVRKQKGLSVKDVCGDVISRSVYNRFVKNRSSTNISNVVYMMKQINLSFDELKMFDYPAGVNDVSQIIDEIDIAYVEQDVNELHRIYSFCQANENSGKGNFQHLMDLCEYSIKRLTGEEIKANDTTLYNYLINVQTWTQYELVMFNNFLHTFSPEFVEAVSDKALLGMKQYSESKEGKVECFRMLVNVVVLFIQNDQLITAWKYIDRLNKFPLEEEMFFEKCLSLVINGLWEIIRGNVEGKTKLKTALSVCKSLGATSYYTANKELIEHVQRKHDFSFTFEE
ncbi:Rgg/GadR/MutR family transcriptional regulator [Enterococcus sp. AZ109]|uniref:Rgg/GadR/MutR family transcriptional regulator n=1 Tax=Enterococcus sp. AZ109 TaxID=2774634 RepID=UPI003F28BB6A